MLKNLLFFVVKTSPKSPENVDLSDYFRQTKQVLIERSNKDENYLKFVCLIAHPDTVNP